MHASAEREWVTVTVVQIAAMAAVKRGSAAFNNVGKRIIRLFPRKTVTRADHAFAPLVTSLDTWSCTSEIRGNTTGHLNVHEFLQEQSRLSEQNGSNW